MSFNKLDDLKNRKSRIDMSGGAEQIEKQHTSGKLTARERFNLLFDKNTFVEINAFVKPRETYFENNSKNLVSEGVVTGYGRINGRLVYAYAQDYTVAEGSLSEMHAKKICTVIDNAMKMGVPIVGLTDSAGARISESIDVLSGYGKIFFKTSMASGVIPQINAIMGPCAGGAVYSPAIADFIFMVKDTSQMFITAPEVIKSVTGEDVSAEELGGAMTHNTISGVSHFLADNDRECIEGIRELLLYLPSNNIETTPLRQTGDDFNRIEQSLNTIIHDSLDNEYEVMDIIARIVDNGEFLEVQKDFARNIVIGFATLGGKSIGIVANRCMEIDGSIDMRAAKKAARFIRTCDAFNIPILNIVDVPRFMPSMSQKYGGMIRHGAKLIYAFAEATVPKVSLIVGKAYGVAYIAMCSKEIGADFVLAWPTAQIAVMGPKGAANIIYRDDIMNADDPISMRTQKMEEYIEEYATPYKAAERGLVDDVIEPSSTRVRLIDIFDMLSSKREKRPAKKHGNISL